MQFFTSSGDLIADRRYEFARELEKRGDLAGAADVYVQAVEIARNFASAWFALGEVRERLGDAEGAAGAFRMARNADPDDRHGAALKLARLGGDTAPMPAGYVRTLFDQYARHYDLSLLEGLDYRGPQLLHDATISACGALGREESFDRVLDLGCGTGLASAPFASCIHWLDGVDLSAAMIEQARKTGRYRHLHVADIGDHLARASAGSADLVIAADSLPYCSDLRPLAHAVASVLADDGLFAFTVETYDGRGVILRETMRYAHGADHVHAALTAAGLGGVNVWNVSSRKEKDVPVPGLVVVAAKVASTLPPSAATSEA